MGYMCYFDEERSTVEIEHNVCRSALSSRFLSIPS